MVVKWLRENIIARIILTIARIWVGWQFLSAGIEKVSSATWVGSKAGVAISGFFNGAISKMGGDHPSVQGWYGSFLKDFCLPNAAGFSYLIAFGELLVGIALIVGLLTTFATLMGIVMNFAYMFAGTVSTNPNMAIVEIFLLVAGFNAAYYGLDYWVIPYLRKHFAQDKERYESTGNAGGSGKLHV